MTVLFRCRIEKPLLEKANRVTTRLGTSTGEMFRIFVAQIAHTGKVPLNLAPEPEPATTKPAAPEEPVPVRPRPVRQHPKSTALSTTATTDLAPGVTVTTEAVEAEVEASQAFRTFVADAKISGVFQGTPSRAFINGRLIRVGEVVDSSLGVRFESVDPATKTIVFKDTTGAKVARRY